MTKFVYSHLVTCYIDRLMRDQADPEVYKRHDEAIGLDNLYMAATLTICA